MLISWKLFIQFLSAKVTVAVRQTVKKMNYVVLFNDSYKHISELNVTEASGVRDLLFPVSTGVFL